MHTFRDNTDEEWTITIDVNAIKRVRGLVGVDLIEAAGGKLLERLLADPVLLVDCVYAICKPCADERAISDEEFGRRLVGDAIEEATKAMLDGLVDFFPNARDRANLKRVLEKAWAVADKQRDLIETRISDGTLDEAIESELAKYGIASTTAPASPASIPEASPSANSS